MRYNGTGDNVLILSAAAGKSLRIVATGESNFAILAYGIDGERLDLLVNEIGAYTGEVLLPDAEPLVLAVQATEMEWVLAPPDG